MSSLGGIASLVIATMDLKMVQSVVTAMRIADLSGAATIGKRLDDRFEPGEVFHPEDRIEPRRVFHPEPRFEQRAVFIEPVPQRLALQDIPPDAGACPCDAGAVGQKKHTIQPPWSKVPWHDPMPQRPVVKVVVRPPDVVRTGKLIDLYM